MKRTLTIISLVLLLVGGAISSGLFGLSWSDIGVSFDSWNVTKSFENKWKTVEGTKPETTVRVTTEESVVIDVVDSVSPAVVTVGISKTQRYQDQFEFNPFDPFSPFRRIPGRTEQLEQDIGSGFIVGGDGLIVTNKHVVEDREATYRVITNNDESYDVEKVFRDPVNDLAILKINANGLQVAELGDSDAIKVGQLAIAIGTALGEFRHTVTTGVISGVGRGITAGNPFEGYVERLDNVIQTDAAINFGNSGGPLLNSSGQVIGVNTAISGQGENIGFAIPINVLKLSLDQFNKTGKFDRPFLGVRYKTVSKELAILNDVPEGAFIIEVVQSSPAERAGLQIDDIIMNIDGVRLSGDNAELADVIQGKKSGDGITIHIWRDGEELDLSATLGSGDE